MGVYVRFISLTDKMRGVRDDLAEAASRLETIPQGHPDNFELLDELDSLRARADEVRELLEVNMAEASVLFPEAVHKRAMEFHMSLMNRDQEELGRMVNAVLNLMRRSLRVR